MTRRRVHLLGIGLVAAALAACSSPGHRAADDAEDASLQRAVSTAAEALLERDVFGERGPTFEAPAVQPLPADADLDATSAWELPAYEPVFLLPAPFETGVQPTAVSETFRARDATVRDVLALLLDGGELGFLLSEDVTGNVSFDMRPASRADALLELLAYAGLTLDVSGSNAEVRDRVRRRLTLPATVAEPDADSVAEMQSLLYEGGHITTFGGGHLELDASTADHARVMARLDALPSSRLRGLWTLRPTAARLTPLHMPAETPLDRVALARAMAWRALDHALAGRHASAVAWRDDARSLDPASALVKLVDGLLALMAGAGGRAGPSLGQAAVARPDCPLTLTAAALADALAGSHDAAVDALTDVATRWPGMESTYNLAAALILAGRLDDSLQVARDADGELAELNVLRAWLFARAGWLEAALEELAEALRQGARDDDPAVLRAREAIEQLADRRRAEGLDLGVRTEFEDGWH